MYPPGAAFRRRGPFQIPIDPNGNLAQKTGGPDNWVYTWNAENQLTKVEKNGAEVARFSYDAVGRRVEKSAAGTSTSYTYDGAHIVRETRGSSTLRYMHGLGVDEPLAIESSTAQTYFHADALGSIVVVTDATGAVVLTRQYDVWGNPQIGTSQAGFAYTGREWDPEIGAYYYRTRYYAAAEGRFIGEDPLGYYESANLYRYAKDAPADWRDPWGLQAAATDVDDMAGIMYSMMMTPEAGQREYGFRICRRANGQLIYGPGAISLPKEDSVIIPPCPRRTKTVARCHTHPNDRFLYPGCLGIQEGVQGDDLSIAIEDAKDGVANYIGAAGKIYKFVPPRSQQECSCSAR